MNAVMQIVQIDRSLAIYILCYVRWTLRDHGIFSSRKIDSSMVLVMQILKDKMSIEWDIRNCSYEYNWKSQS